MRRALFARSSRMLAPCAVQIHPPQTAPPVESFSGPINRAIAYQIQIIDFAYIRFASLPILEYRGSIRNLPIIGFASIVVMVRLAHTWSLARY